MIQKIQFKIVTKP